MSLARFVLGAVLLVFAAGAPASAAGTGRSVQTAADPALQGTLLLPEGTEPVPVVLMIPGSGPVDRDGNLPGMPNNSLRLLAEGLAEQGVASLRTDKRGIGASRDAILREQDLRFETYVEDTLAWLAVLAAEPRLTRVFLAGHSEGALVGLLAAQRVGVAGIVLIAGAGEPVGKALERQLAEAGVPAPLQARSRAIVAALQAGQAVGEVPPELMALFRPSVQPYMASWLRYDPAAEIARLTVPALIVQGTNDIQIAVADARKLAAAKPDAQLELFEGMNHVLKRSSRDRRENLASYTNPAYPLAPKLVATIAAFVKQPATGAGPR